MKLTKEMFEGVFEDYDCPIIFNLLALIIGLLCLFVELPLFILKWALKSVFLLVVYVVDRPYYHQLVKEDERCAAARRKEEEHEKYFHSLLDQDICY